MSVPFQTRFIRLAAERSPLCVGIDPSSDALKGWGLTDDASGLRAFCQRLVEVCAPLVASVKPQAAFFERHGPEGMAVLRDTVAQAHGHGTLAIIDAKCGDISSTAAAYAEAFLGPASPFGGDALTVSAYLGFAALAPIFDIARRESAGIFVVVRSSNPEGAGLQHAVMPDGRTVAECLADDIAVENTAGSDNGLGPVGAVIGGTLGSEAAAISARMQSALLLVPGIGAQGATVADVRRNFAEHFARVIPSMSRSIAGAGPDLGELRRQIERQIAEIAAGS
jgi:orotidine-5'-phosphate decarboxylase